MRVASGSKKFCAKLKEYLDSELAFSHVAQFKVDVWKGSASWDLQLSNDTHMVTADDEACKRWTASLQIVRGTVRDFRGGWTAAQGL
jgi:hypothetical protein